MKAHDLAWISQMMKYAGNEFQDSKLSVNLVATVSANRVVVLLTVNKTAALPIRKTQLKDQLRPLIT
ncbi:hypothetical protein RJ641_033402 [Dillenia turbinata]|uniref:Uncharacterized protein n=1 Tax=Dillenia turbinata TaxID=194707 RepID=A0AAN8VZK3_9MAGN